MLKKKEFLEFMDYMPDSFSREEIIDKIILFEKIQIGMEQAKMGKSFSLDEVKVYLASWIK